MLEALPKTLVNLLLMATRVLTLFGEEIIPEPLLAVKKTRAAATNIDLPVENTAEEEQDSVAELVKKNRKRKYSKNTKHIIPHQWEPAILQDWEPQKQYYPIGEVAILFKLNTSHIRYWTNEFALRVRTTAKGDRLYNADQIQQLRMIFHLVKEKGFTIAGARAKLKEMKNNAVSNDKLKNELTNLKNKLIEISKQL